MRASSAFRMWGMTTPSAPASRISVTRARAVSTPSSLMGGMRTRSVGGVPMSAASTPADTACTAAGS